ncbi:hypothetical protein [Streptomyces sp. NPDC006134]|uniref:hypothetical protein n=1 Tax=Streptomyces sp. NPDC006134 TaxID=3154467 RepID=UPI00340163A8
MAGLARSSWRSAPFGRRLQQIENLLQAGHPHRAAAHCAGLQHRAAQAGCPAWAVTFGALRAEALLRQGDPAAAEQHATAALRTAAPLGPAHRLRPAAVLAETLTAQGRLSEAAHFLHLDQPADDGPSAPGPHHAHVLAHLRAQGSHHLAARRHRAALAVFLDIGRRVRRHGPGRAPAVAWRIGAAEALLALGRPDTAAALLAEQLTTAGPTGPRDRGTALRLRAATESPARRPATLAQAVALLRVSGDRLELARAYTDLGRAAHLLGDSHLATAFGERARHLTETCGVVAARPHPVPAAALPGTPAAAR